MACRRTTIDANAGECPNSAEPREKYKASGRSPRKGPIMLKIPKNIALVTSLGRIEFANVEGCGRGCCGEDGGLGRSESRRGNGSCCSMVLGRDLGNVYVCRGRLLGSFLYGKLVTVSNRVYDWVRCNHNPYAGKIERGREIFGVVVRDGKGVLWAFPPPFPDTPHFAKGWSTAPLNES